MKTFTVILISCLILSLGCNSSGKPKIEDTETTAAPPAIMVGKGPDALFLVPEGQFLYVANVEDTTISIINTSTEKVVKTINGIRYPWGFVRLGESNQVAVSAYDKQLVIIDFTTHQIIKEQNFDTNIGGITATKDGSLIYIINIDEKLVLQLDGNTLETLKTFPTGKAPDGIGISKDDSKLFVTNTEDGTISVIDINTQEQELLQTGGKPELIHSNHDRSLLFISNFIKSKIHVLDTEKGEIIRDIEGIKSPEEAVLSADEKRLYIVSFDNSEVYVYDSDTYEKLNEVYKTGSKPIGVMPVKDKLYISNYGDNSVSIIQLKN
jgi:YVTN family beta-propeller protein